MKYKTVRGIQFLFHHHGASDMYKRFFDLFIFFNLYLIFFFIRHILSLSIADLMLILTAVPFVSVVYTVESWPWGNRMCVVSEFMKDFSTGVSVFTLVAMSLDRFVAIVNPLRRFQGTGKLNLFLLLDHPYRLRTFHHTAHFWFFIFNLKHL